MIAKIGLGCLAVMVIVLILGSIFLRNPNSLADEGLPAGMGSGGNEVMARLLDLNPGVWEKFNNEQRIEHVESLITQMKKVPPGEVRGKFPALYYVIATLLNENNRAAEAFDYLEEVTDAAGTDDWLHFAKSVSLQNLGKNRAAIDELVLSLSYKMAPDVGQKLISLSRSEGLDPAQHWPRVRQLMADRSLDFTDFSLTTPEGQPRTLADFKNEATLAGFFFPG